MTVTAAIILLMAFSAAFGILFTILITEIIHHDD